MCACYVKTRWDPDASVVCRGLAASERAEGEDIIINRALVDHQSRIRRSTDTRDSLARWIGREKRVCCEVPRNERVN